MGGKFASAAASRPLECGTHWSLLDPPGHSDALMRSTPLLFNLAGLLVIIAVDIFAALLGLQCAAAVAALLNARPTFGVFATVALAATLGPYSFGEGRKECRREPFEASATCPNASPL